MVFLRGDMKYILLSDIHANDIALHAVLAYAENMLKSQGEYRYLFLGDAVGYGTTIGALNCIRWLRSHPDVIWIPGNHDEWIAGRSNLSFQGSAVLSLLIQKTYLSRPENKDDFLWFQTQIISAIEERPALMLEDDGLISHFTHASVKDGAERVDYLYPWNRTLIKWNLFSLRQKYPDRPVCLFFGHTHYPLLACLKDDIPVYSSIYYGKPIPLCDGMVAVNPGSVGQPRDGDPRSSFAVLDTKACTITFHRVQYDVEEMVMQLEADGNFESRMHTLSWGERDAIIDELKRRKKKLDTSELRLLSQEQRETKAKQENKIINAQETYKELISRIRAGNRDANLSLYNGIYRKVDGGLEVVT